jgi:hypothetical protein
MATIAKKSSQRSVKSRNQTSPVLENVTEVAIDSVFPSPENDDIYGAIDTNELEQVMLARDIAANGIHEPIIVSADGFIVSGHRRYAAARRVRLKKIPVRRLAIRKSTCTSTEWKRLLASHNKQRVKSAAVRIKESLLSIDPEIAYQQMIDAREARDAIAPGEMLLQEWTKRSEISVAKLPMLESITKCITDLKKFWPITVRQVHYRLLNVPPLRHSSKPRSIYRNDRNSYQDLCDILARARLVGLVPWASIEDETRPVSGLCYCNDAAQFITRETDWFLDGYRRDLMQSQQDHIEFVAEKMTVQSIIKPIVDRYCIPLTIGRGYCSLDPRRALAERYQASGKDRLILLVASDLDPDGDSIAESFARSIRDDFGIDKIVPIKAMLKMDQVRDWELPPNKMAAKKTSVKYSDYINRYGTDSVYELEAIDPNLMQREISKTIDSVIDVEAFNKEIALAKADAAQLLAIKQGVAEYLSEMDFGDAE